MQASDLYNNFQKIRHNIDLIETTNLSKIKEIIKRVHFADISGKQQELDNKGNAVFKLNELDRETRVFDGLSLSYTIEPKKTGVVYGIFSEKEDKDGFRTVVFSSKGKANQFNNYARFLADLTAGKIIYSTELTRFVIVKKNAFKVIDETSFLIDYPVERASQIPDFLQVIEQIYSNIINVETHDYIIHPYSFCGTDFVFDCETLELTERTPTKKDLFFECFEVAHNQLDIKKADDFFKLIADGSESLHNLRLVHAYTFLRRLNLVPPEYFFILKDFGRTGKGLFMKTFTDILKVNTINFDSLANGGFEALNEWFNLYGCGLAHANETGEITTKQMRILRKIATSETVTARGIGKDSVKFKIKAVLILDTNESVDIGDITANTSRTVKIAFKDRPTKETDTERHAVFKPYWDFIQPNGNLSLSAEVSFLIYSLNYLKKVNRVFTFETVEFKSFYSTDELTDTQKFLILALEQNGFILRTDEALKDLIREDYGSLRFDTAKKDFKKLGVTWTGFKFIDGKSYRVVQVGNDLLFNKVLDYYKTSDEFKEFG